MTASLTQTMRSTPVPDFATLLTLPAARNSFTE